MTGKGFLSGTTHSLSPTPHSVITLLMSVTKCKLHETKGLVYITGPVTTHRYSLTPSAFLPFLGARSLHTLIWHLLFLDSAHKTKPCPSISCQQGLSPPPLHPKAKFYPLLAATGSPCPAHHTPVHVDDLHSNLHRFFRVGCERSQSPDTSLVSTLPTPQFRDKSSSQTRFVLAEHSLHF